MPIIFITGRGNVPMSVRALKEGALDFLEKPFESETLLECIQRALAKSREGREVETERVAIERRLATLSPRECQVLALVVKGMLNKQIAGALGAAEKTIKIHRGRVMGKMDAASVAELVRMTYTVGFADPVSSFAANPSHRTTSMSPRRARAHYSYLPWSIANSLDSSFSFGRRSTRQHRSERCLTLPSRSW